MERIEAESLSPFCPCFGDSLAGCVAVDIRNSSEQRDTGLDLFGASGTTMIAAERTGRSTVLLEIDPCYVDVIVRRWQEMAGGIAVLGGGDRAFNDIAAARVSPAAA